MAKINFLCKTSLIGLLRFYQIAVSPLLGYHCRFFPSCSQYAIDAIKIHGIWRGLWLSSKRLARCHPACKGGVDPVPISSHREIVHD